MNRRLSLIVVIALAALLALLLSASGVVAREGAPQAEASVQPQASQCLSDPQAARIGVFGQVFDEQGTARAGLRVQAIGPDGLSRGETRTQADGRYSFTSLPAGHYTLRVLDQHGRLLSLVGDAEVVAPETEPWIERDLVLASSKSDVSPSGVQQTGQITGVVTASGTGLPLADVFVTAYDAATGSYRGSDYTDSAGKYVIGALATGSYKIQFDPSSFGASKAYIGEFYNNQASLDTATPINVTDAQTTPNINAVLQLGGQITGKVIAADTHNPLDDVSVSVNGSGCPSWYGYASTDANGVYTVTGVPTGNNYKVYFDPSFSSTALTRDYVQQYYNNKPDYSSATPVAVTAPNVVNNINAALLRGGKITGVVTGQGSGGLSQVAVTAVGQTHFDYRSFTTSATGAYTLTGLLSDTYTIKFAPSSYGPSKAYAYLYYSSKATRTTANAVAVTAPNVTPNINQVLPLGSYITGKVTTADTSTPILNADITVYDSDGASVTSPSTNASGVYTTSIALPTGSYRVGFQPSSTYQVTYTRQYYNNKSSLATANVINVTAPNLVSNINAALARGGQISGTITADNTGLPLQSISVSVYDSSGSALVSTSSDAAGAYATPALPAGDYRVRFGGYGSDCTVKCYTGEFYDNKSSLATATVVHVVASQVTRNINAALAVCPVGPTPPSGVSISGPVTGTAYSSIAFSASVNPVNASTPFTYTWQTAGQSPVKRTGRGTSDTFSFTWFTTGTKTVTVTAANAYGSATNTRTILIKPSTIVFNHRVYLPVVIRP